ncbi:hypothetical protein RND71_043712 [Anisodus tanguticus]|uniref:Uncharacterized protein n=1 Tax=Anisodus tanguticus TaxID=243964 RepID=A0AAE1QNX6_9SOLA|nr:hypothetical protein RND71_043712 [Anisodus tanguticus]
MRMNSMIKLCDPFCVDEDDVNTFFKFLLKKNTQKFSTQINFKKQPNKNINTQKIRLMCWDTAGQEEFDALTNAYYRDSNKSNSTVTTTIGNCIRDYDPISMAAPTAMRTPVAWQHREMNISRPSSAHRRSLSAPRNHQQQVVEHKKTAAATAAAVIAQLKSNNDTKNYCQQPFKQKNNVNKLNSWSSNSINNNPIIKQQNYQINKQLQQQQQFLRQQMLHRKKNNSSSPSVATTSSDDREEVPIVKHCRRIASSRTTNNPVPDRRTMVNQLNRQNQIITIPQSAMLPIANSIKQDNSNGNCLPTPVFRNATLRSTRSIPALVLQQKKHQQMKSLILRLEKENKVRMNYFKHVKRKSKELGTPIYDPEDEDRAEYTTNDYDQNEYTEQEVFIQSNEEQSVSNDYDSYEARKNNLKTSSNNDYCQKQASIQKSVLVCNLKVFKQTLKQQNQTS